MGVHAKSGDPRLNHSREIPPEVVGGGGILNSFFRDNFLREVVSGVMSGLAVEWVGMDAPIRFGESRSNRSLEIFEPLAL